MRISFVVQWVKDPVLSLQWLGSLLWGGFDSWPRNFCMLQARPKKKKKKKKRIFYSTKDTQYLTSTGIHSFLQ